MVLLRQKSDNAETTTKVAAITGEQAIKMVTDTTWKLVSLNNQENPAVAEDAESFTLKFLPDSALAGTGACNRFNGQYAFGANENLTIKMGGSTRMACPNLNLEQDFFTALSEVTNFAITPDTLSLFKGEQNVAKLIAK